MGSSPTSCIEEPCRVSTGLFLLLFIQKTSRFQPRIGVELHIVVKIGDDSVNCKEVQSNILLFFQDELEIEQLELFLEHIEHCEACREELEVYYTLHRAMQILEDNQEYEHTNYQIDIEWELYRAKEKCKRFRRRRVQKNLLFVFLVIATCILIF